jgi:hypothetical protein
VWNMACYTYDMYHKNNDGHGLLRIDSRAKCGKVTLSGDILD